MKLEEIIETYFLTKIDNTIKVESQRVNRRFFEIRKLEHLWNENKEILEDKVSLSKFIGSMNVITFNGSYSFHGICLECTNDTDFVSLGRGFKNFCSKNCEKKYRRKSNIQKFGGVAPASSDVVKDKMKKTNNEKYGGDTPMCSEEIKIKVKNTNLEKYGVENVFQHEEFKEKSNKTRLERYGFKYTFQDKLKAQKAQIKIKETNKINLRWYNYEKLQDFECYKRLVELNQRKFQNEIEKLENYDKRGFSSKDFHLDHMYSKRQGFEDGILPYYIGYICNLEMLEGPKNMSKGKKCSQTAEDLFKKIEELNFFYYKFLRTLKLFIFLYISI